ncbi:MAG: cobyrinate a,c-diamide synthase, partial [Alphaproteobacteria bacterium]|nr:cobyrinate a,c-diamide synthase [Alphaproteobacteria bacterium]
MARDRPFAPGVILAAPASNSGKTVITLALLRHFARAGAVVTGMKSGPDYIDPAFHAAAAGRSAANLDPWAMRPGTLAAIVKASAGDAALVLCEGVMGLFDGIGPSGLGSTADLAVATGWPVILIVDVRGQATSAAATIAGFARFRPDVPLAGVIFNRVGGARHIRLLEAAVAQACPGLISLGGVPRDHGLALPDRHLGLVQAREHGALEEFLDRAADLVGRDIDTAALQSLARPSRLDAAADGATPLAPLGQSIAVARDDAFAFAYQAVLDGWRRAGAEILPFSPLGDQSPASRADAVYLPGGYPELHAGRLAGNRQFIDGIRIAAARGATIYGECGGYMVMGAGMVDEMGIRHAMTGLLPLESSLAQRRLHLGYRRARLLADGPVGPKGAGFRGH